MQNVEFAGSIAADTQGYLKNVNVTQELLAFGPNVQPVTVVAGGSALAGVIGGADTFLKARASGIPVVAIGTMYQKAPSGLLSLAKNPIRTPKDAVGKKIGLQTGARGPWATILSLALTGSWTAGAAVSIDQSLQTLALDDATEFEIDGSGLSRFGRQGR